MNTLFRGAALVAVVTLMLCPGAAWGAAAKGDKGPKPAPASPSTKEASTPKDNKDTKETKPTSDTQASTSYQYLEYKAATFVRESSKQAGPKKITLKGNVELKLIPEDSSQKPLIMHAAEAIMKTTTEDGNAPDTMELNGKVSVDGEMGTVTSNNAVMDMKTKNVTFTGAVVFNLEMGDGKAESLIFNMDTQEVHMTGSPTGKFQISQGDGPGDKSGAPKTTKTTDPSVLKISDISDWAGLIGKIQEQAKASASAPGKQIMKLLSAKAQGQFAQIPAASIPENMKGPILGQLNQVIRSPKFYDAKAWQGITLDDETNALLRRPTPLQPEEVSRLNRLLLEAAYPNTITPAKKGE